MNDKEEKTKEVKIDTNLEWHLIDAKDKILGRMSTEIASLLLAKHRVDATKNTAAPVYVVVTNTDHVKLTGKKEDQKFYRHYTGHPGGLKERSVGDQRRLDSRKIVEAAVIGMLPKNKLRSERMRHLKLYAGAEHDHVAQLGSK